MNNLRVLTFTNYGDTEAENSRTTLSPMNVKLLMAFDDVKQERPVKRLLVLFLEGDEIELFVSEMDLLTIEQAIGVYGFIEAY